LLIREALEIPARTVALVTPDRTLARRVSGLLERWDLEVDDSAGQPLASTPAGSFLLLLAEAADAAFAPVPLLSLLKHPLSALGQSPERFRRDVRALEIAVLRGPAPAAGFDGLRVVAAVLQPDRRARIEQMIDRLEQALGGYAALVSGGGDISAMLTAHIAAMEALAATDEETGAARLWRGDDGEASSAFLEDLRDATDGLPPIAADDWSELLTVLLAGSTVRRRFGQHPRLSILSPMEARLQQFDQVILGGLNEQVWPPADRADPWMSRPMRREFGLPTADRRVGLAAHDFAQLASQPDVIMTRADRRDGAPTVASRWIDRLTNLLDGFHDDSGQIGLSIKGQTATYLAWLRIMDRPLAVTPVTAPAP
ncbi:MAG: double-strand break repair protein AddB, partial [Rhodospirillales bacterium]